MTLTVVPASKWKLLSWRPLPSIAPTSEWWVHHGATGTANLATLRAYERYHVQTLGWSALGYNWAITADGTIYEGRGWLRQGAHTKGRNTISHAVLLVGDWSSGTVPQPMVDSLVWLTREGHRIGALKSPTISGGHRDAPGQSTSCPGAAGLEAVGRARKLLSVPVAPKEDVMADLSPEAQRFWEETYRELQSIDPDDEGAARPSTLKWLVVWARGFRKVMKRP